MKYVLEDKDIQDICDKIKHILQVKYKEEIGDVPDHIVNSLTQNYIIQCKNNDLDIDKLLEYYNIGENE
jgi:hypothetical protein